jgi:Conjugative transposon protein TcpC
VSVRAEPDGGSHAGVRVERRSLRRLELHSSLPRYVLYAVALVAIAHSLLEIARPTRAATVSSGSSGLDAAAAAYATSFARAYLTYDSEDPSGQQAAVAPFVGAGPQGSGAGFTPPSSGSDSVDFAQVVGWQPAAGGGTLYTVQADTSRLGTVYLAVTVARGGGGALELVGEPALVGAPAIASGVADPSQANLPVSDPGLAAVVTRALSDYLRGDSSDLQSDLATGVSVPSLPLALSGVQVTRVAWQVPGQVVGADVQASDQASGKYSLHYQLSVIRQGRWYMTAIESTPTSGGA